MYGIVYLKKKNYNLIYNVLDIVSKSIFSFIYNKDDIVVFLAKRDQLPVVENMFRISSF